MGASASALSSDEIAELHAESKFDVRDIQLLYKRFAKLDRNKKGYISAADLALIPELSMNPLQHRIIALFDEDGTDQVNFHRFVQTLAVFSDKTASADKLKFAFRCYDVDGDGVINDKDLFHILKMLVGSNLSDAQLALVVAQTLAKADRDRDGVISFAEFAAQLGEQVIATLTIKHVVPKPKVGSAAAKDD